MNDERLTTMAVVIPSDNKSAIQSVANFSTCLTDISHSVIDDEYTKCISMYLICLSSGEHNLYVLLYHCSRLIDVDVIG